MPSCSSCASRPYYRPAHVLAERLGVECVEFPGGHTVYQEQPEEFAGRLLATFSAPSQ